MIYYACLDGISEELSKVVYSEGIGIRIVGKKDTIIACNLDEAVRGTREAGTQFEIGMRLLKLVREVLERLCRGLA